MKSQIESPGSKVIQFDHDSMRQSNLIMTHIILDIFIFEIFKNQIQSNKSYELKRFKHIIQTI
jgi:hypothetical protein